MKAPVKFISLILFVLLAPAWCPAQTTNTPPADDKAEKIVKQFKPMQPGQSNDGMAIAVDVWGDRGLKVELQPLVVKQLKLDLPPQPPPRITSSQRSDRSQVRAL